MSDTGWGQGRGRACESPRPGFLGERSSTLSSLAYLAAAALPGTRRAGPWYAVLVAGIGVGSVVQHGPNPRGSDLVHDLPLSATLAFVAADAAAALRRRPRQERWWLAPTVALVPVVAVAPRAADALQAGIAAVAVGLSAARAVRDRAVRRRTAGALALLVTGSVVGTLSDRGGPLCRPGSPWQGHAAWHALSAAALVVLAPVVGSGAQRATVRSAKLDQDLPNSHQPVTPGRLTTRLRV